MTYRYNRLPTLDSDRCRIEGCADPFRKGEEQGDSIFDHLVAAHGAAGVEELLLVAKAQNTELRETAARAWCQCCVFGNHTLGCTCASKTCCWHNHPNLTYRDREEVSMHHFHLVLDRRLPDEDARRVLQELLADIDGITIDPLDQDPATVLVCAVPSTSLDQAVLDVVNPLRYPDSGIRVVAVRVPDGVNRENVDAMAGIEEA